MIASVVQQGKVIKVFSDRGTGTTISMNNKDFMEDWNSQYVTVNCNGMQHKLFDENGRCVRCYGI